MKYYNIIIQLQEIELRRKNRHVAIAEFDIDDYNCAIEDFVRPYVLKENFFIDGKEVKPSDIYTFKIYETEHTSREIYTMNRNPRALYLCSKTDLFINLPVEYGKDITSQARKHCQELYDKQASVGSKSENQHRTNTNKIFVVHGHDKLAIEEVSAFLRKFNLQPIILAQQADKGKTVIEKIEEYTDVDYGIILYTGCDRGCINKDTAELKPRARQNVVFEHGYLMGKLGRNKVSALLKEDVELPSDVTGIMYIRMDSESWQLKLANNLKALGFSIDLNNLLP